jgi:hypothetical protein
MLRVLECYRGAWMDAVDDLLEAQNLSAARLVSAKRKLLQTGHFTLLHSVIANHFEGLRTPAETWIPADEFGFILYKRIGQLIDTTRQHLKDLTDWGFLDRHTGNRFLVRVPEPVAHRFRVALTEATADMVPPVTRLLQALPQLGEQNGKIVEFDKAKVSR